MKFKSKLILFLVAIIAVLLLARCGTEKEHALPPQRLNVCIAIDPSDRICQEKHPRQAPKDIAVADAVLDLLIKKAKQGYYLTTKDRLRIDIIPQESTPDVSAFMKDLSLDPSSIPLAERHAVIPESKDRLLEAMGGMYDVISSADEFSGGDIYKYFSQYVQVDPDTSARSVVLLITDGYVFSKSNQFRHKSHSLSMYDLVKPLRNDPDWESRIEEEGIALLPLEKTFPTLEVLVLGLESIEGAYNEFDIVKRLLEDWFKAMKVRRIEIHPAYDSPEVVREVVTRFLETPTA